MRVVCLQLVAVVGAACLASLVFSARAHASMPPSRLLDMYEPVTQFDPLESFRPTRVQSFITDSDLEQLGPSGSWTLVDAHPAPGDLPDGGTGTWRLNQRSCTPNAPIGGLACYAAAWNEGAGGPVVYGRVAREGDRIVLQYWYFYYDDVYSYAYPPIDFIWQAHEGDWEVVNVVLSDEEQPLFVGYSQHCAGQRRAWADAPRFDKRHPIVHVALGSHANYFTAGVHPINVQCIPPLALAFLVGNKLTLPVDYAFEGAVAGPPSAGGEVMPVEQIGGEHAAWLRFPGFWGEQQYFHAPAPIGSVALGTSPRGPAYQAIWSAPMETMAEWPG
jgi:hypothetical protein